MDSLLARLVLPFVACPKVEGTVNYRDYRPISLLVASVNSLLKPWVEDGSEGIWEEDILEALTGQLNG